MPRKKKRLMYPEYCDTCGEPPVTEEEENGWTLVRMDCPCGGRIVVDFKNPYYEEY